MAEYYCGVDIGGTNVRASLADREGIKRKLRQNVKLKGSVDSMPSQIMEMIKDLCGYKNISLDDVGGIGISSCGPFVKRDNNISLVSPNLCGGLAGERGIIPNDWVEIFLEKELVERYNGEIKIENDCVSAVVAESLFGAGRGEDNLVYVTWSTGIGAGAYTEGRLLRGKNGNAPHLGHIFISEDGPLCGCGNRGDLESMCSGGAIARDYGVGDKETEKVFNSYSSGDIRARDVVQRAARNFARGLASINAILDTKTFVIGGGVFMNNYDILLPLIEKEFYKSFPILSKDAKIEKSQLDDYLGDVAALSLVVPENWIRDWQEKRPWEKYSKVEVFML